MSLKTKLNDVNRKISALYAERERLDKERMDAQRDLARLERELIELSLNSETPRYIDGTLALEDINGVTVVLPGKE